MLMYVDNVDEVGERQMTAAGRERERELTGVTHHSILSILKGSSPGTVIVLVVQLITPNSPNSPYKPPCDSPLSYHRGLSESIYIYICRCLLWLYYMVYI